MQPPNRRAAARGVPPDPEVTEKPLRRKFIAEYKLRILAEADRCSEYGRIGALLRPGGALLVPPLRLAQEAHGGHARVPVTQEAGAET